MINCSNILKRFLKGQAGVSLLETLLGTALVGMLATAFLGSISTIYKTDFLLSRQSKAEVLARSQLESIKASNYIDFSNPLKNTWKEYIWSGVIKNKQ